jgi:hypothetical protein
MPADKLVPVTVEFIGSTVVYEVPRTPDGAAHVRPEGREW